MNTMVECLTPVGLIMNAYHSNPSCTEIYQSAVATDAGGFAEYLPVFVVTCLFEFPVYFLFLFRESSFIRMVLITLLVNLATHPIIYLGMPAVFSHWDMTYLQYLLIAESFAPIVEALLLKKVFHSSWRMAIWSATIANLFSWTVGAYWQS